MNVSKLESNYLVLDLFGEDHKENLCQVTCIHFATHVRKSFVRIKLHKACVLPRCPTKDSTGTAY